MMGGTGPLAFGPSAWRGLEGHVPAKWWVSRREASRERVRTPHGAGKRAGRLAVDHDLAGGFHASESPRITSNQVAGW